MRISTHRPSIDKLYRKDRPKKFNLLGHAAAFGMSVASTVQEGIHYARLAVDVLLDERPFPMQDEIFRKDILRQAISKHRRTYVSNPAPPLGEASPMRALPKAELKKPLMMVPGWDMAHDRYLTLTEKLTEGGSNGGRTVYLRDGTFYHDRDCREPLPEREVPHDTKVFVAVFKELGESPETSAPQLAANMRAMERVTGEKQPDIFAYSQGGLATRKYLDDSGDEVGKLLMLGTPNMGAGLAGLSTFLYDAQDKGYAVDFLMRQSHLDDDDEKAMRFMSAGNSQLRDMNSRWERQMDQTDGFLVVGSAQDQTLHWGWPPRKSGDTMVEVENLAPEGVERELVEDGPWVNHRDLPYSAQVYEHMRAHFGWSN